MAEVISKKLEEIVWDKGRLGRSIRGREGGHGKRSGMSVRRQLKREGKSEDILKREDTSEAR